MSTDKTLGELLQQRRELDDEIELLRGQKRQRELDELNDLCLDIESYMATTATTGHKEATHEGYVYRLGGTEAVTVTFTYPDNGKSGHERRAGLRVNADGGLQVDFCGFPNSEAFLGLIRGLLKGE